MTLFLVLLLHPLLSLSPSFLKPLTRFKNAYNLQVKQSAKPCFPIEYLLVNLTHGFPIASKQQPLFLSSSFPVANRQLAQGDPQHVGKVVESLVKIVGNGSYEPGGEEERKMRSEVEKWASDWHLLGFLDKEGVLGEVSLFCFLLFPPLYSLLLKGWKAVSSLKRLALFGYAFLDVF